MRARVILAALLVAPVLGAADKPQELPPIDLKARDIAVTVPKDVNVSKPIEITSAEELAKSPLFTPGAAEKVKKEVNFEREKLVVVVWTGAETDRVLGVLGTRQKKTTARFYYTQSGAPLPFQCARLFVVPRGAEVSVCSLPPSDDNPEVREIPLKGLKCVFPEKPGGVKKPEVITSAAQLAESPTLAGAADELRKHVNFETERLVLIAWRGSSADKFTIDAQLTEAKLVLTFKVTSGTPADLHKHTRLFVVSKEVGIHFTGGD
jgi:hypothetical protein